jgi:hypothetical protein
MLQNSEEKSLLKTLTMFQAEVAAHEKLAKNTHCPVGVTGAYTFKYFCLPLISFILA